MKCGVKFCGGCNPRYERGQALNRIKEELENSQKVDFSIAEEGKKYDRLLVIGGCTNCCASYKQYDFDGEPIKMWDKDHIDSIINKFKQDL